MTAGRVKGYLACWGTYPGGRAAPSPKKKSSICLATRSWASFCQGIRRYSLRIIFMRSSHSFQASLDTLSKIRGPSSPGHGIESIAGSSFWNLTHMTLRPLVLVEAPGAGNGAEGPQESAMLKIVVDLTGAEDREFWIDCEHEVRVRGAQRLFNQAGPLGTREDEPQIARAFGQRHQQLIRFGGDVDLVDALNRACRIEALDPAHDAPPRDRDHHHAARRVLSPVRRGVLAQRVTQQELFERGQIWMFSISTVLWKSRTSRSDPETQRPRAQAADRTRGDFEDEDAGRIDAAFRVDRTVMKAERARRAGDTLLDGPLRVGGRRRGRQIDRFLEE